MRTRIGFLSSLMIVVAVYGCGRNNPAAVLEGTWQLIFDEPGDLADFDIRATFDSSGQLTQLTADSPEGGAASLDVSSASTTEVDGSNVTITIPTVGGSRVFEGTLSSDQNTIDGALSLSLELPSGDLDVTLPASGLTLVRIQDDGANSNDNANGNVNDNGDDNGGNANDNGNDGGTDDNTNDNSDDGGNDNGSPPGRGLGNSNDNGDGGGANGNTNDNSDDGGAVNGNDNGRGK